VPSVRIVGGGRAGSAFASALADAGWKVGGPIGRADDVRGAAASVDLVLIATPDAAVAAVAAASEPVQTTVVAHVAGSLGLDVLGPHADQASIHPLVALPAGPTGASRLAAGGWFAIAGSTEHALGAVRSVVGALGGRLVEVPEGRRTDYHAAACVASNHVVALLGQVQRIAEGAGVPLEAYLDLLRATVENVAELGPAAALTGPVARGDWATVRRHLAALDPSERAAYEALAAQARRLVDPAFDPAGGLPLAADPGA